MVGSLRYICNSRPNIAYGVGFISRFVENPKQSHLLAVKRMLRYLKGTIGYGILYPTNMDSNAPVSWCSKKQDDVALSSCEVEYIAASMSACQAVWLDTLMDELKLKNRDWSATDDRQ
ncbi:PREDICTED: uncharacterized protein LOC109338918 [Lupinus angustifolius]|uniref:uncharacterized protein LOC109338918 n=1 Tax=Lupinus angustifolius TaxID=3871 RepID=UPI00092F82BB|nr:PREDICTED: uncharacterized protein LOC109338918 [Lupinus angustifolius]